MEISPRPVAPPVDLADQAVVREGCGGADETGSLTVMTAVALRVRFCCRCRVRICRLRHQ